MVVQRLGRSMDAILSNKMATMSKDEAVEDMMGTFYSWYDHDPRTNQPYPELCVASKTRSGGVSKQKGLNAIFDKVIEHAKPA